MKFEYTGRHVEVTPGIRKHVEEHFKKLHHIFNGTEASAHVIITVEKNRHIGEVVVFLARPHADRERNERRHVYGVDAGDRKS